MAYLYARPWPVQRVVAVLSAIFMASGLVRLGVIVADGQVTGPLMTAGAVALVPTLAGIALGTLRALPAGTLALRGVGGAMALVGVWFTVVALSV